MTMTNSVNDYFMVERLYHTLIDVIYTPQRTEDINPDDVRRPLDAVLSAGKVIGRQSALKEMPTPILTGQEWRSRICPDDMVVVEEVAPFDSGATEQCHVFYRHTIPDACPCGFPTRGVHARREHESRNLSERFVEFYELVTPSPDRLIED